MSKRFCKRGHDTLVHGRTKRYCNVCHSENGLVKNITEEKRLELNARKRIERSKWTPERKEEERNRMKIVYENIENDPIRKMLRQTRSRIRYREKLLKDDI